MLKKLMKRTITAITMGIMLIAPMNVFAAETMDESNVVVQEVSARASDSFTMVLPYNMASVVEMHYMGFNPTVRVTATGNPNLLFKVWVVNPAGITGEVGYVTANGSTIEKNLWMSIGGNYYIYIQPWSGSSNGKSTTFNFNVTW